jgi:hypothetical protein
VDREPQVGGERRRDLDDVRGAAFELVPLGLHPPVGQLDQLVDGRPAVEPARLDVALGRVVAEEEGGVDDDPVHHARHPEPKDHPVRALVAAPSGLPAVVDLTAGTHGGGREHRVGDLDQILLLGVGLVVGHEHAAAERTRGEIDQVRVVSPGRHGAGA